MRGKDEWERISWDEALDYIAAEASRRPTMQYGQPVYPRCAPTTTSATRTSIRSSVCSTALGGCCAPRYAGTVSLGSWSAVDTELFMTAACSNAPDALAVDRAATSTCRFGIQLDGQQGRQSPRISLTNAREQRRQDHRRRSVAESDGRRRSLTSGLPCVRHRHGAGIGMMLSLDRRSNLYDQEFLDTYCVGFDAEHMPEGAPAENNSRKDYVLGTGYDIDT